MLGRRASTGLHRRERGSVAVEFALVMIPLVTLLFGILQYGWYFYSSQSASSAAREVTRRLVVGDCQGSGEMQAFAEKHANVPDLQATMSPSPLPAVGQTVTVTVTADGKIIGFLPMPNGGIVSRQVEARVEDRTAGAPCS